MEDETQQSTHEMSIETFAELLGQKPQFQQKVVDQAKKDISILQQLGMTTRDISKALGLSKVRGPRAAKATAPAKKTGKAA